MMTQNKMVLPGVQRQKEGKIWQEVRQERLWGENRHWRLHASTHIKQKQF
jgi:hypothetical protein